MRLLIIGKMDSQVIAASKIAKDHGASVNNCPDIEAALSLLRSGKGADLLMIDVRMKVKMLIDSLQEEHICVPVVGYGVNANSQDAVNAIKAGAKEYIPLPPDEKLIAAILEAISDDSKELLYKDKCMEEVITLADRIAPSDASVLITGESGTGKEVIAQYIHKKSKRANQPFIAVNCAAIPDNLLESELFGHEKGAFTGAAHRRIGKFEESNNGTLLLDEISEMDLRLQAKLLRAIQEQVIDRVGGTQPVKLNLRVLATSNRNLQDYVREGKFREDLYFRINVIEHNIPPLREREEDIVLLANHFAKKYAESNEMPVPEISKAAMDKLANHDWSGNVRELENTMHRAVLLASNGEIQEDNLLVQDATSTDDGTSSPASIDELVGRTMDSVEKELILKTLDHCLGNRTHAANVLGISIRTLRNKLKLYNETGT